MSDDVIYSKSLPALRHPWLVFSLVGLESKSERLSRRCSSPPRRRFPSRLDDHSTVLLPHQASQAPIFSFSPILRRKYIYIRRGSPQTPPNSIHQIHRRPYQPAATATATTHRKNLTNLHHITTPTLPTHNAQNGCPQPGKVCRLPPRRQLFPLPIPNHIDSNNKQPPPPAHPETRSS